MKIVTRNGRVEYPEKDYKHSDDRMEPVFTDKLSITDSIYVFDTDKDTVYKWKVVHREEWIHRCEKMEVPPGYEGFQGVEFKLTMDGGCKNP